MSEPKYNGENFQSYMFLNTDTDTETGTGGKAVWYGIRPHGGGSGRSGIELVDIPETKEVEPDTTSSPANSHV